MDSTGDAVALTPAADVAIPCRARFATTTTTTSPSAPAVGRASACSAARSPPADARDRRAGQDGSVSEPTTNAPDTRDAAGPAVVTPADAWRTLLAGNARFADGNLHEQHLTRGRRAELAHHQ